MGAIHFSIDVKLAELLVRELGLSIFVETGTFQGDSVELVKPLFQEIHTCELSPELHQKACSRFEGIKGIHCHLGPSEQSLQKISRELQGSPVLYWLDAHWCAAENTAGEESQCPLLEELDAITPLHADSVVWIDDARYLMSPPPKPHVCKGWPKWHEVHTKFNSIGGNTHQYVFANDTILLYPKRLEDIIWGYLWENGVDLVKIAYAFKEKAELTEWSKQLTRWDDQLKSWNTSLEEREKKLKTGLSHNFKMLFRK